MLEIFLFELSALNWWENYFGFDCWKSHFLGNIKYLAFLLLKKTCCIVFKYSGGKLKFSPQFLNNTCIQMFSSLHFIYVYILDFFLMQRGPNWIFKIYKSFELNELHLYTECYENMHHFVHCIRHLFNLAFL